MVRWIAVQIVLLGFLSSVAFSQQGDGGTSSDQRRRLIEQKMRLVESLVNSPAAQASTDGGESETAALVLNGRQLLDQVREALATNKFDQATTALDEALRSATRASARLSSKRGMLSNSVQQTNYKNLAEQVATYRNSIEDLAQQGSSEARSVAARITALQSEAVKLAEMEKLGDANRKLADAYKLAVESISKLRAGQTVTMSLKFDTPVQEYDYERRRFQSSEILVDMMIGEGRSEGERRNMVNAFVREGKQLLGVATDQASGGDYKSAVAMMEKATAQLNRALQVMGVPVY